ncbi:GNAT family N-acetyltransferase [Nocardia higoensis]|uniref:GNAT family N-acetyltransferase n=1 Tax=Nocardia higoensis TaxID=228599 RepID=UPI0006848E41|nr:GNAT family N-acetyltransferase [Nocardia higoensis]
MTTAGPILLTPRLRMRPLRASDAERLHEHWNDPGIRRNLFDDEPVIAAMVVALTERSDLDFAMRGYGFWTLVPRSSRNGKLLGVCGLRWSRDGIRMISSVEEGHRGEGLALEACRAVLDYAFGTLGLDRVIAAMDEHAESSIQLCERLGMVRTGTTDHLVHFEARAVPPA